MARKQNLKFLLMQELGKMYEDGKGRSKHQDKIETERVRVRMKAQGATYKESLRYNAGENYIYSTSTFDSYVKHIKYFCTYVDEVAGSKKLSVDEAKQYIQPYIDYLAEEKGWSAYSINLALSSICKATHEHLVDYSHPKRELKDIVRGKDPAKNDELNERLCAKELEAAKVLGLRRSQLEKVKVSDVREINIGNRDAIEISVIGKGGKMNHQIYYFTEDIEAIRALIKDKQPDEHILDKQNFRDCDFHSCRAYHAKHTYERIVDDMKNREGAREEYLQEARRLLEREGKEFNEHDYDRRYFARGEHKKYLEEHGFEVSLDRLALQIVSLTCLAHNRVSVTAENYIWK